VFIFTSIQSFYVKFLETSSGWEKFNLIMSSLEVRLLISQMKVRFLELLEPGTTLSEITEELVCIVEIRSL